MTTLAPLLVLPIALAAATAPTIAVDGAAVDALYVQLPCAAPGAPCAPNSELWISASQNGRRRLVRVDAASLESKPSIGVARGAMFVDACALPARAQGDRVVFADAEGLVVADGDRVIKGSALFSVPDPDALYVADLCSDDAGELRLFTRDGLRLEDRTLKLKHEGRAYSGQVHRGFRPERGYGEALSLFAPRMLDVDVDADARLDLVLVLEEHVWVYRRTDQGLEDKPLVTRDLRALVKAPADADLRVRVVDVDGDRRADLVVGVTQGAVPERSEAWLLSSSTRGAFSTPRQLWKRDGLVAPIGSRGAQLIVAEVDTSLVSLSGVLLTGRVPVLVRLGLDGKALALQAKVDVRAGRMEGALPVVTVDFDGDGINDLLDLGVPGRAALHKGTSTGFALDATTTWDVPSFVHVVPLREWRGVVLIGEPSGGRTRVAFVSTTAKQPTARATRSGCDPALDFDCK